MESLFLIMGAAVLTKSHSTYRNLVIVNEEHLVDMVEICLHLLLYK